MNNAELYNVIFKRKSVRKYDMTQLEQEFLAKLQDFTQGLKKLNENIKIEFSILSVDKVKSVFAIKAPHYICIYSEKKDGYLMNAGFVLQQVDLFLSANNTGSCWLGVAKPDKDVPLTRNGLDFVIMLAFGNATEPVHRASTQEFKRNNLSEITSIKGAEQLLEPARLAPSAVNSQTWFFSGDTQQIIVSRKKLSLLKAPLYGKMNQIDTGIVLCHLWLSLENQSKKAVIDFNKAQAPDGYEFMARVKVEG